MGAEALVPGARESARDLAISRGLPSGRHEDWRFTAGRLSQLAEGEWRAACAASFVVPEALASADLVLVDGVVQRGEPGARPFVGSDHHALDAVNRAGAVESGGALSNGDVRVFVTVVGAVDRAVSHVRRTLTLEAGSARVVEVVIGGDAEGLLTQFTRFEVGVGASLTLERVHLGSARSSVLCRAEIALAAGAEANVVVAQLGGRLGRDEIAARLDGSGASVSVRTLSFASAGEHLDLPVYVDHVAPGCTSRLDLRGLVAPSARFVTNGRVTVHRGAVGTDADQQSRNLLLGEGADLHAKPELQIFCDDIKASHGNAIGALDEAQVHYLRSRGIVEEDARLLIISGFAEAVLTGLGSEVLALAQTRLREALAAAGGVA